MSKLKIGDKVEVLDPSYLFGVMNGHYNEPYHNDRPWDGPFTVIATKLNTIMQNDKMMFNGQLAVADILITDDDGGFWFAQSCFLKRVFHTITFDDGSAMEINDVMFGALKQTLSQA